MNILANPITIIIEFLELLFRWHFPRLTHVDTSCIMFEVNITFKFCTRSLCIFVRGELVIKGIVRISPIYISSIRAIAFRITPREEKSVIILRLCANVSISPQSTRRKSEVNSRYLFVFLQFRCLRNGWCNSLNDRLTSFLIHTDKFHHVAFNEELIGLTAKVD